MALTDGVVLNYHFNEALYDGTPGEVIDSSPTDNNGTSAGATIDQVNQKLGSACVDFTTNDKIDLANTDLPTNNDNRTIAFWFKTSQATAGWIFAYGKLAATNAVAIGITGSNITVSNFGVSLTGTTTIADNAWHYLVLEYDHSGPNVKVWLDNSIEISSAMLFDTINILTPTIGTLETTFYTGKVDEFVVKEGAAGSDWRDSTWNNGDGIELFTGGSRRRKNIIMRGYK